MLVTGLPKYRIKVSRKGDLLPAEAEHLFSRQLTESRRPLPQDRWDRHLWNFALIYAVTPGGHVLGGIHLDLGPIGGSGPLAKEKLAYIERTLVRPKYRRHGLGTRLLEHAIRVARRAGCLYLRCSNNWDNKAERRLFLKCGFALIDLDGESDPEPSYLAIKSLV